MRGVVLCSVLADTSWYNDQGGSLIAAVLDFILRLITVTSTIASTTATASTTTSSAAASTSSILETILLVVLASLLPVVLTTATRILSTSSTSTLACLSTLIKLAGIALVRLNLPLSDKVVLFVAVSSFAHDFQIVVLPLRLGVNLDELVRLILVGEGDEHGALEETLVGASEFKTLDFAELSEEALKVELGVRGLIAEALDVNGSGFDLGLGGVHGLVGGLALDDLLTVLTGKFKKLAVLESSDDGAVGLESSHTLEGVDSLDLHGLVFASAA